MNGKVIPFGYADGGVSTLERLMALPNAYLVDIRFSPWSKIPAFTKDALSLRFPGRYVHIADLGNVNYNNRDNDIEIANAGRGIPRLIKGIQQGRTLILMCGCKEYEACHRHTVTELLHQAMPEAVVAMPDETGAPNTLKCLSIQNPWAWLIVNGIKDLENRDWTTTYRGPLLIHAGAKLDRDWFNGSELYDRPLASLNIDFDFDMPMQMAMFPVKSIVGIATLVDVVERSESPWFVGRYGFVLKDARAFSKPIPYSGSLKLFDVPEEVVAQCAR